MPTRGEAALREVSRRILQSRGLPANLTAESASSAVLCALTQEVGERESGALRPLLQLCVFHRDRPSVLTGRARFLDLVAEHVDISPGQAEDLARVVLRSVRECLPAKEAREIEESLTEDLKDLWRLPV